MRTHALLLAILTATIALSGCFDGDLGTLGDRDLLGGVGDRIVPTATVALIDTGINPYHVDFRDNSSLANVHPSLYLPGYPAEAPALDLNLDGDVEDAQEAYERDAAVWENVEPRTLYWVPGTKIVGLYVAGDSGDGFSTGHGTMTASRAAGNAYSLCPECRITAVQGFNGDAVTWASQQPWIDAQSNSWSPQVVFQQADAAQEEGLADAFADAATRHLVFGSAGNGVMGKFGVVGHPSFTRSTSGPPGVVSVGGHDNGEVVLWSGSWPHVVADACANWAAVGGTIDEYSGSAGGGTSSASPYAAGEAARIVLEARRVMHDGSGLGVVDGVLARGTSTADGPLSDGDLTLDEAKEILFKTAAPRPVYTDHDGESCVTYPLYNTVPVAWEDIPSDVPAYYVIGYGQVSVHSLAAALEVVGGDAPLPDRSQADQWHAYNEQLRAAYYGLPH